MTKAQIYWQNLFYRENDSADLNLFRSLFCAFLFISALMDYNSHFREVVAAQYQPLLLLSPFGQIAPNWAWVGPLYWFMLVSLLASTLGLFTRTALISSFLSFTLFTAILLGCTRPADMGYGNAQHGIVSLILLILAFSPGVTDKSLLLLPEKIGIHIVPSWPTQLIKITLVSTYFSAALCKLSHGFEWFEGGALQGHLLYRSLILDIPLGVWVANHPWLCLVISVLILLWEFLSPLSIIFSKIFSVYMLFGLGFHLGAFLIMGIHFFDYFGFVYLILLRRKHLESFGHIFRFLS